MDRKIISVSSKRQITIPLKFYRQLKLENEVECSMENGALVIRPMPSDTGEFAIDILKELLQKGLKDDELVAQFAERQLQMKNAIGRVIQEADDIASGKRRGASMKDVFGKE